MRQNRIEDRGDHIRRQESQEIVPSDLISTPRASSRCDSTGKRGEQALDDHADIGARLRRRDDHELLARVHGLADRPASLLAEFLDQARVDVELGHIALGVAFEA